MSNPIQERTTQSGTPNNFDAISIRIASSEDIKEWSKRTACRDQNRTSGCSTGNCTCGEVRKPETINYRTFRPERDGLFCEAIFGPQKDWECGCGKYKRIKHKGVICDRCGVEVTQQKVRRDRMGYIDLAAPVSHIWFFKGLPSRIGLCLDLSFRDIERIIYFESFIVLEVNAPCDLEEKQLLTEEEYTRYRTEFPDSFRAGMGADAIQELLKRIDLDQEIETLQEELEATKSKQKTRKLSKRLKLMMDFKQSGNQPDWLILTVIPVIPPDLRPLVALDGGRFATSDLNDLYRRVINRNNRLKRLMELRAPEVIIRNEKRMLQEAVDALLDNGRHGRIVRGPGNRPLKSLSDMLKGKPGRFRQNLLGKRVDYSGRTVIVVGPELQLHQCGLPKKMALELFKPFIIHKLQAKGYAYTIKRAKNMAEQVSPEVWEVLEEVIDEHPVLLNRAPTLHRLGIQAFQPVLVEGKAIRVNPLVCEAFNADFDGDQMAVHVPLSVEAQVEAKLLMMATRNLLKPAHGGAIAVPNRDVAMGCSFLTKAVPEEKWEEVCQVPTPRVYRDKQEIILAHECGALGLHDPVKLYFDGAAQPIETTVGRVIFDQAVPNELLFIDAKTQQTLPFFNQEIGSRDLSNLVSRAFEELGNRQTVEFIDDLKRLGFHYATLGGLSIAMQDMIIPHQKAELIREAWKQVEQIEADYRRGDMGMSEGERYNKVIDVWHQRIEQIENALFDGLEQGRDDEVEGFNPVHIMVDSGAISRSKRDSIRQLAGLRGLMAKPSGEIIERPIESCFHEGLSVLEYFISTHGARKGLADTAIKTASSGYLTRKLVDVAQDVIVRRVDCGTLGGITKTTDEEEETSLSERIFGRTAADDIIDSSTGEVLVPKDALITHQVAEKIEAVGIPEVRVRSVLTCEVRDGACAKCYGTDLTSGHLVDVGEAIGIIAAQSIGEPGTQLTMRTFHTGGTASGGRSQSQIKARHNGTVQYHNVRFIERPVETDSVAENRQPNTEMEKVVVSRNAQIRIVDENGYTVERHTADVGARLYVEDEQAVTKEDSQNGEQSTLLLEWDPYQVPILTEHAGHVVFRNIVEGKTMREDKATGLAERVIIEHRGEDQPQIEIHDEAGEVLISYQMPTGAHLSVTDEEQVKQGAVLARLPREKGQSRDIVTGLPRVTELFEARRPKDTAVISKIEGYVELERASRGVRILRVVAGDVEESHRIPQGKHLIVQNNDIVEAGERLTDGPINPHDILEVKGEDAVQNYLVNEVQDVYRTQGERINDKHIEVIVRQMLGKVRIENPGDTEFLEEEERDRVTFNRENDRVIENGGQPATAESILQGITKASLSTESFISAASFQQTTNVLTKASVSGKQDRLVGLKENVIMGHLIPAGTGVSKFRKIRSFPKTEAHLQSDPDSNQPEFLVDEPAAD